MKPITYIFFTLLVTLFFVGFIRADLKHTLENIAAFQAGDGAFVDEQLEPSVQLKAKGNLEYTSLGVFVASLFSQTNKFSVVGVAEFVKELAREDGGFARSSQEASDLQSTAEVLTLYSNLGAKMPNPQDILAYTRSLFDEETGLYATQQGRKGSIEGTAAALQIFTYLGSTNSPFVTNNFGRINDQLNKAIVEKADEKYFSFPGSLSKTRSAYLGTLIGTVTKFDFEDSNKFVAHLKKFEKPDGGFSTTDAKDFKATFEAVSAISLISAVKSQDLRQHLDLASLSDFIDSASAQLSKVGYAQRTAVASGLANSYFKAELILEDETGRPITSGIIQGSKFKPTVRIQGFEGVVSPRFVVQIHASFGGKSENYNLLFSKDQTKYVANEFFDTGDKKGQVEFSSLIRLSLAGTGVIVLDMDQSRTVGYGIDIDARANLEATGNDIAVGETVSQGTDFTFELQFIDGNNQRLTSGDFDVIMTVIDSSNSIFDQQKQNAKDNSDGPLVFTYKLEKNNIASGKLTFRFEVSEEGIGIHSTNQVTYEYSGTLIASSIQFEGAANKQANYKLGDRVTIGMTPAVFPDLKSVIKLDQTDLDGKMILRNFFMDIVSPNGDAIQTVKGIQQVAGDYLFIFTLKPSLDNLGNNILSFRYVTADGSSIDLQPYDNEYGELFEDASQVKFNVPAQLYIKDVKEEPTSDDFSYGNTIGFKFKVQDKNSGKFMEIGARGSNVFLSLQHKAEDSNIFTSENKAATQPSDYFEIDWRITPNAIKGAATIIIYAENAAKQKFDILNENNKPVTYKVNIGGEIDVEPDTYTSSVATDEETTVVTTFSLTCQSNPLLGARLSADLETSSGKKVASNLPISSLNEQYQVSLTIPHDKLSEGSYIFKFYRDTDLSRFAGEEQNEVKPLFTVPFSHSGTGESSLPISPQLVIFLFLVGAFVSIFMKRSQILVKKV